MTQKPVYELRILKKTLKNLDKMPLEQQQRFHRLAQHLRTNGPFAKDWPNYAPLGKDKYHCHLSHHWVACWSHERETIVIEVYYAGSRENAPY